jgi:hypothetical protein
MKIIYIYIDSNLFPVTMNVSQIDHTEDRNPGVGAQAIKRTTCSTECIFKFLGLFES